jgi:hypothetical protein
VLLSEIMIVPAVFMFPQNRIWYVPGDKNAYDAEAACGVLTGIFIVAGLAAIRATFEVPLESRICKTLGTFVALPVPMLSILPAYALLEPTVVFVEPEGAADTDISG